MSHGNKEQNRVGLNHDPPSQRPSNSTQPPMAMTTIGVLDHDSRTYMLKRYRTQFASAPAAMISVLAGSPFENIKTRMQSRYFPNAIDCIRYTYRTEGARGFWAGTTAPVVFVTVNRVWGFSVYQKAKYALDEAITDFSGKSPLKLVNTPGTYPDWSTVSCFTLAGAISGATLAVMACPFELVKNASQTSVLMASDNVPRGTAIGSVSPKNVGRVTTWGACKQIIQRRGLLGFYTGFRLHVARDIVGSGIYFGVYEATKQMITSIRGAEKANTFAAVATAGTVCGAFSWAVTYPLDTMKTRAQNMLVGRVGKAARESAASLARSSKWRGIEMIIIRSSVQNMIQMCLFEYFKAKVNDLEFRDGTTEMPKKDKKNRSGGL